MRRPVIGVPTYRSGREAPDYAVRGTYCDALAYAGGAPILIPPLQGALLRTVYLLLDGLLLAGGGDVAAEHYGASVSPSLRLVDTVRDDQEITLTRWALCDGLPVFGICRGIQILNVAAGGTLIQDIPSEVPSALQHSADLALPRSHRQHDVSVQPASRLAAMLSEGGHAAGPGSPEGSCSYGVNSYHHQAVKELAPGFTAVAYAPDGITEAIEAASPSSFVLGVQWHPEGMVPGNAAMERLFSNFVGACRHIADTCQGREVLDAPRGCTI